MRIIIAACLLVLVAGCGHSPINYTPSPPSTMTWERATSIIERGFHEDYGDQRPQSVLVTDQAIILADGNITTGSHAGTAVPVYGAAVIVGTSTATTVAAGQHIYLDSLQPSIVVKRNGRDHRYAVIIRTDPGFTARRVFFRSAQRAQEFADALEYVRRADPPGR